MRKASVVIAFLILWIVLTILALTWGFFFDWPDNVHVDYGFPLVWAVHTLNTIAGPVDRWRVDLSALVLDLFFWLGVMTIAVAIMLRVLKH